MTMLAETVSSATSHGRRTIPDVSAALARRIRAEFLEMPGLKLTLPQAARVFGADAAAVKPVLDQLRDEGFLVREPAGVFRRCTAFDERVPSRGSAGDLLDAIGIEVPCMVCQDSYRVSLRKIRLSQLMMDDGCSVRHFSDCPPAALFQLIDPETVREFEAAVARIEAAAEGIGGRVAVPPRDPSRR
ncbi:MAG TPA: hypothetical protein VGD94_05360 [Vicinamibacterales bacterium]